MKKSALLDKFGREITYLRIGVIERCNLRCTYCMPAEGIKFLTRSDILSFEEIIRIVKIAAHVGIRKIRLTGGEPLLRKNIIYLIEQLSIIDGIDQIHITTNGLLLDKYLPELAKLKIAGINLSLDTLEVEKFEKITRRKGLDKVLDAIPKIIQAGIPLKINTVILPDVNTDEIIQLAELAKKYPLDVRFIEAMPFNGQDKVTKTWDVNQVKNILEDSFGKLDPVHIVNSSSLHFIKNNFLGKIGIIPAFSRSLCGSCNRLRLTSKGVIKTCLYDLGVFNMRELLRHGATDKQLEAMLIEAVLNKAENGFIAEKLSKKRGAFESMATIGG